MLFQVLYFLETSPLLEILLPMKYHVSANYIVLPINSALEISVHSRRVGKYVHIHMCINARVPISVDTFLEN